MPKTIELTVEIAVQRVSCPGVWLCQDGRVSLTVFALGTNYQTCLLPPTFPLMFKDVFYFQKRFQESCALNNICCLLKEESIYCELLQWCEGTGSCECEILAQYLGALNDVLFPPNMCSNEGVDLLMRRSKDFPGILSPKIEIATKVRIDEVWNQPPSHQSRRDDHQRQIQQPACHSANFHRNQCTKRRTPSTTRLRSRSSTESTTSRSCCSMTPKKVERHNNCIFPKPKLSVFPPRRKTSRHQPIFVLCRPKLSEPPPRRKPPGRSRLSRDFCVYNVNTSPWRANEYAGHNSEANDRSLDNSEELYAWRLDDDSTPKTVIESHYIEHDKGINSRTRKTKKHYLPKISPCICEICKRYHELFHINTKSG